MPQLPPGITLSSWMPSVKPALRACVTSWHVVNLKPAVGCRMPGIFSISSASKKCFMPIGRVRMRSSCTSSSARFFRFPADTS